MTRSCDRCGLELGDESAMLTTGTLDIGHALDVEMDAELERELSDAPAHPGATPPPIPDDADQADDSGDVPLHRGIPERVPGVDPAAAQLTPFEGYLLSIVDGATHVDDVVAASGLSGGEAARALQRLSDLGLLRFRDDADQHAARRDADGNLRPEPTAEPRRLGRMALSRQAIPVHAGAPEDPDEHRVLAEAARDSGDYRSAREHVRLAWMLSPDDERVTALKDWLESPRHAKARAKALHDKGAHAHRAGDYPAAARLYASALQEFEPSAVMHHKLAMALVLAGEGYDVAEKHLVRAMELHPGNPTYASNLERLREMKAQVSAD